MTHHKVSEIKEFAPNFYRFLIMRSIYHDLSWEYALLLEGVINKGRNLVKDEVYITHLFNYSLTPEGSSFWYKLEDSSWNMDITHKERILEIEDKIVDHLNKHGKLNVLCDLNYLGDNYEEILSDRHVEKSLVGASHNLRKITVKVYESDILSYVYLCEDGLGVESSYLVPVYLHKDETMLQQFTRTTFTISRTNVYLNNLKDKTIPNLRISLQMTDENVSVTNVEFNNHNSNFNSIPIANPINGADSYFDISNMTLLKNAIINANDFTQFDIGLVDDKPTIYYVKKDKLIRAFNLNLDLNSISKESTSVGRFIKKFTNDIDINVEAEVNRVKASLLPPQIEIVSGYDIAKYYNGFYYSKLEDTGTLSQSCMRYDKCQAYLGIYVTNPNVKMMIIKSRLEEDKIVARALVWENAVDYSNCDEHEPITIMDRYYGPDKYRDYMRKFAMSKGWHCKSHNTYGSCYYLNPEGKEYYSEEIEVYLKYKTFTKYPYMDTFRSTMSEIGLGGWGSELDSVHGGIDGCGEDSLLCFDEAAEKFAEYNDIYDDDGNYDFEFAAEELINLYGQRYSTYVLTECDLSIMPSESMLGYVATKFVTNSSYGEGYISSIQLLNS